MSGRQLVSRGAEKSGGLTLFIAPKMAGDSGGALVQLLSCAQLLGGAAFPGAHHTDDRRAEREADVKSPRGWFHQVSARVSIQ